MSKRTVALLVSALVFCATPVLTLVNVQTVQAQQSYLTTAADAWSAIQGNNGKPTTYGWEKAEAINSFSNQEDLSRPEAEALVSLIQSNWGGQNALQSVELQIRAASGSTFKVIAVVTSKLS